MNESNLNPGIANTVAWLRAYGFKTTDSGDGATKDFACDLATPYVHMLVFPDAMIAETRRLVSLLAAEGIVLECQNEHGTAPTVEATFHPFPGIATISLYNVFVNSAPPQK